MALPDAARLRCPALGTARWVVRPGYRPARNHGSPPHPRHKRPPLRRPAAGLRLGGRRVRHLRGCTSASRRRTAPGGVHRVVETDLTTPSWPASATPPKPSAPSRPTSPACDRPGRYALLIAVPDCRGGGG